MATVRLTGFFADDDGHGWSEQHDIDGGVSVVSASCPPDVGPLSVMSVRAINNAPAKIMAQNSVLPVGLFFISGSCFARCGSGSGSDSRRHLVARFSALAR